MNRGTLPAPPVLVPQEAYTAQETILTEIRTQGITHEAREVLAHLADQVFEMHFYRALLRDIYSEAEAIQARRGAAEAEAAARP